MFDKSNDQEIIDKCPDIEWHLIGHVQSNKINKLLAVRNLKCVQTIDSIKLAQSLNAHIEKSETILDNLDVYVQINTSQEECKSFDIPEYL